MNALFAISVIVIYAAKAILRAVLLGPPRAARPALIPLVWPKLVWEAV